MKFKKIEVSVAAGLWQSENIDVWISDVSDSGGLFKGRWMVSVFDRRRGGSARPQLFFRDETTALIVAMELIELLSKIKLDLPSANQKIVISYSKNLGWQDNPDEDPAYYFVETEDIKNMVHEVGST